MITRTKLEELKRKECSIADLHKYSVGTGTCDYETKIELSLDSPNHNSYPIEPEWFRQAVEEMWYEILEKMEMIAKADITFLKHEALIEAAKFLKDVELK